MFRRATHSLAASALLSCCLIALAQPPIEDLEGSSSVEVLRGDKGARAPVCTLVGRIEVSDGRVTFDGSAYRGTVPRIEQKLRNAAVEHDANVAFVLNIERPLVIDSPGARGQGIQAAANLYRCNP